MQESAVVILQDMLQIGAALRTAAALREAGFAVSLLHAVDSDIPAGTVEGCLREARCETLPCLALPGDGDPCRNDLEPASTLLKKARVVIPF
jgi:hypothetical protein